MELEPGRRAVAVARFPATHDVFADHFPGKPIVPGTLLIEAMAQTAGWSIAAADRFIRWPLLIMVERAKFRRVVGPDEDLRFVAQIESARDDHFVVAAESLSGQQRAANARLVFQSITFDLSVDDHRRFADWARQTFVTLGGPRASEGFRT